MLKISLLTLLVICLCLPAMAREGDPLDNNDSSEVMPTFPLSVPGCENAEQWPDCVPCWTECLYALMADAWCNGGWNNGDNW